MAHKGGPNAGARLRLLAAEVRGEISRIERTATVWPRVAADLSHFAQSLDDLAQALEAAKP